MNGSSTNKFLKSWKAPVTAEVELSFSSILLRRYDNLGTKSLVNTSKIIKN